jgi:hypothetical protein
MVGLISVLACKTEARSNDVGDVVLYIYQIKNQFFCTIKHVQYVYYRHGCKYDRRGTACKGGK